VNARVYQCSAGTDDAHQGETHLEA
jgi:hypothetical protein